MMLTPVSDHTSPIANDEIRLWLVHDQQSLHPDHIESCLALLSPTELVRYQRFQFDQHKRQYLLTRALVRSVLAEHTGQSDPAAVQFGTNQWGKPELVQSDTDTEFEFNLSHTDGLVALAVTPKLPIGIDVESVERKADILNLGERYFSPLESSELNALPPDQQTERFYSLWTLKEAYIKACGMGLKIPLADFSFRFSDEHGLAVGFSEQRNDNPLHWQFWRFAHAEHYRLALALNTVSENAPIVSCFSGSPLQNFEPVSLQLLERSGVSGK